MKKTFLILLASGTCYLATACNSPSDHSDHASENAEAHHTGMHEDSSDADHANMSDTTPTDQLEMESVALLADASPEAQQHIRQLTDRYLELKNALVKTDAGAAKTAAEGLLDILKEFDAAGLSIDQQSAYSEQAEQLHKAAGEIAASADIKKQREQFVLVTKSLYALNKAFEANSSTLYYQYCPMAFNNKGGYWLSAEQEVRNPYFGDKMLKCGRVAETL